MSKRIINIVYDLINIYGKKLSMLEIALIFLFPIFFMEFYKFLAIPEGIRRLSVYAIVAVTIVYSAKQTFFQHYKFNTIPYYIKWVFLVIIMSSFVALFTREQGLILSYRALNSTFLGYIYFFLLYKIKPHPQVVIKLILTYAIIYVLCFIWGVLNAPNIVFEITTDEINDTRGFFRLCIRGLGYVILLFYYSIVKAVKNKKWYVLSIGTYILILFSLTRQTIVISLLVAGLYLTWKKIWLRITIVILALFMFAAQDINIKGDDSSIVGSLVSLTLDQSNDQKLGDENIRITAIRAFLSNSHQNIIEVLLGIGYFHPDSNYGKWEERNFVNNGYYRSDVGYVGTYVTFGVLGLILFILTFYTALKPRNVGIYVFAQLYICHVLLANVASWPFRSNCVEISICLYLLSLYTIEKNNLNAASKIQQ